MTVWKWLVILCGLGFVPVTAQAASHHRSVVSETPEEIASRIVPLDTLSDEAKSDDNLPQLRCLALEMYHEARGGTVDDQIGVGLVVLNRIKASGKSVCETIWKKGQFPWVHRSVSKLRPRELAVWTIIQGRAIQLLNGPNVDITNGATMFYDTHHDHRLHGVITKVLGDHTFLRPYEEVASSW